MGVNDHQAAYIIDLDAKGKLFLRTNIYLVHHDPCGEPMGDWWKAYSPGYEYSENLKVGGIKIWADGGSCNVPAVSFEFPDGIGYGDLYFTHEELSQIVADLDKQGYQVAIHTAGDRSLELIQDVYNDVLGDKSNAIYHRIEHNAVIRPELLENYPETGVVLTVFGSFPTCAKISDEFHFKFDVPDEYQTWEWPWRDLLDANTNLPIAWHTDWPLTTFDTMQQLYGFTTRKQIAEDGSICEPTPDIASGIINREEALRIMTIGGAYALAREDEVGSLEPGKYADIVILSDNPLKILPDDLLDIEVYMTMIGGQVMYCAEGQESLCP
jgi:predicted amidohydrolase YtcJ